ncbi:hypothetical protein LEP1GSC188_4263 [Leptospira weilii serovar Topaz str. LT2116]|uniref:Uncharacterized protein n=1 Tax=Leptospira weilii serovar Topaz str. LT2116 TaxID=1088540 RepID=M3FUV8_9LEPT|nr:hypothetical protein LEP1GSC188_4263 [Leptospira weilii serovar Topaz str. LT2116]
MNPYEFLERKRKSVSIRIQRLATSYGFVKSIFSLKMSWYCRLERIWK